MQEQLIQCRLGGSHSSGYESSVFWDITPCSILKVEEEANQETSVKAGATTSSAYSSTLKMQETFSPETSVWRYIPEDRTQLIQNLKTMKRMV
jgi:hypothetical protein